MAPETPTPTPRPRRRSGSADDPSQESQPSQEREPRRESSSEAGTGGTAGTGAPRRPTPTRTPKLQKQLEEFLATPALIYGTFGDEYGAYIIATRTPAMAEAWYKLAQENAGVRRVLTNMVEGSAWGGVVLTSLSVILPLLSHHGVLPIGDPFAVLYGAGPVPAERTPAAASAPPTGTSPRASGADAPADTNGYGDPMAFRAPDRSIVVE